MAERSPPGLVPVRISELQAGMYVAGLDRVSPELRFPAQGFLLTASRQIDELARHCSHVYVDPARSDPGGDGDEFSTGLTTRVKALGWPETPLDETRRAVHRLAHECADTLRRARRADPLPLDALRLALEPVLRRLAAADDDVLWVLATELRVPQLNRRALGSATLMALFGQRLGFTPAVVEDLALAGALLDIGKITVPVAILAKPGRLSGQELGFVQRHVRRGLYLVRSASIITAVTEEALVGHHERLDGTGYPRAIRGTRVPLSGRIAGIVDTYDALTSDRRYAKAAAPHEALQQLHAGAGRQFDAALTARFIESLGHYPTGSWLQLADGRIGIVRSQVPEDPRRPRVALISDGAGRALGEGALWRPARRGDIIRVLAPGEVRINDGVVEQALNRAAMLAA